MQFPIRQTLTIMITSTSQNTHETDTANNVSCTTISTILTLAIPTFGQLIAEPAFVLIDTAIVGHVGGQALAGLSVGSTIVLTVVGLCVFLAYSTTSQVGRLLGAGKRREGLEAGVDGLWLAGIIGVVVSVMLFAIARPLCMAMGAQGAYCIMRLTTCVPWCSVFPACCWCMRPMAFFVDCRRCASRWWRLWPVPC